MRGVDRPHNFLERLSRPRRCAETARGVGVIRASDYRSERRQPVPKGRHLALGGPHQAGLRFPRPPKSRYKGGFPLHFEQNLIQLLGYPDKVLHPFGGMAEYGTRVDLNPAVEPDVVADAHELPFEDGEFDAVVLDPPYSDEEAERLEARWTAAARGRLPQPFACSALAAGTEAGIAGRAAGRLSRLSFELGSFAAGAVFDAGHA